MWRAGSLPGATCQQCEQRVHTKSNPHKQTSERCVRAFQLLPWGDSTPGRRQGKGSYPEDRDRAGAGYVNPLQVVSTRGSTRAVGRRQKGRHTWQDTSPSEFHLCHHSRGSFPALSTSVQAQSRLKIGWVVSTALMPFFVARYASQAGSQVAGVGAGGRVGVKQPFEPVGSSCSHPAAPRSARAGYTKFLKYIGSVGRAGKRTSRNHPRTDSSMAYGLTISVMAEALAEVPIWGRA